YDGDGWIIVDANGDGVPDKPDPGLLRAYQVNSYDDQGRPYRTYSYNVDQVTGSISSAVQTSQTWYDHRGQVVETVDANGLVEKKQYDGAGRQVEDFKSDGGADAGWADATNVIADN